MDMTPALSGVDPLSASVGSLDVYIRNTEDTQLVPAAAQDEAQVFGSRQLDGEWACVVGLC